MIGRKVGFPAMWAKVVASPAALSIIAVILG